MKKKLVRNLGFLMSKLLKNALLNWSLKPPLVYG